MHLTACGSVLCCSFCVCSFMECEVFFFIEFYSEFQDIYFIIIWMMYKACCFKTCIIKLNDFHDVSI